MRSNNAKGIWFGQSEWCGTVSFDQGSSSNPSSVLYNSAAYIGGWLKAVANDKRLVVTAASQGQKAADYIMGGE